MALQYYYYYLIKISIHTDVYMYVRICLYVLPSLTTGRKVQVIGRPQGRPTKSIKSGVLMTCTLCHATLQSVSKRCLSLTQ